MVVGLEFALAGVCPQQFYSFCGIAHIRWCPLAGFVILNIGLVRNLSTMHIVVLDERYDKEQ